MNAAMLLSSPPARIGHGDGPSHVEQAAPHLLDHLPRLVGRVQHGAELAPYTWFRVGGPAEVLVKPASAADLGRFLAALPHDIPVTILGAASNVIIRDGGIEGVVIRLARGFNEIKVENTGIIAGAACLDATVAEYAAAAGLAGLEFLSGIPGSIGGAVAMNAGAYGGDVATCLDWAEFVTRSGDLVRMPAAALAFAYRHASLPAGAVIVGARLRAHASDPATIAARMAEIRRSREATHQKAWELIDAAGARGLVNGGAQVSEKHCNFLLNNGSATAADLEGLGEDLRRRVEAMSGVLLEWEIKRLGVPAIPNGRTKA
jgi:UDP-N-acetylmuramate dehydrogenase